MSCQRKVDSPIRFFIDKNRRESRACELSNPLYEITRRLFHRASFEMTRSLMAMTYSAHAAYDSDQAPDLPKGCT